MHITFGGVGSTSQISQEPLGNHMEIHDFSWIAARRLRHSPAPRGIGRPMGSRCAREHVIWRSVSIPSVAVSQNRCTHRNTSALGLFASVSVVVRIRGDTVGFHAGLGLISFHGSSSDLSMARIELPILLLVLVRHFQSVAWGLQISPCSRLALHEISRVQLGEHSQDTWILIR